jgi:hypothetical protein
MNKQRPANIGLAIWRLKCFYETFVQDSTAVILLNISVKNPPHRQAENRYLQPADRTNQALTLTTNLHLNLTKLGRPFC